MNQKMSAITVNNRNGFPLIEPSIDIDQYVHVFLEWVARAKLFHWAADEFTKHKVLDELHEHFENYGDKFVEVYAGMYRVKPSVNTSLFLRLSVLEPEAFLVDVSKTLGKWRHHTDIRNTALDNLLQDLEAHVANVVYLYRLN